MHAHHARTDSQTPHPPMANPPITTLPSTCSHLSPGFPESSTAISPPHFWSYMYICEGNTSKKSPSDSVTPKTRYISLPFTGPAVVRIFRQSRRQPRAGHQTHQPLATCGTLERVREGYIRGWDIHTCTHTDTSYLVAGCGHTAVPAPHPSLLISSS